MTHAAPTHPFRFESRTPTPESRAPQSGLRLGTWFGIRVNADLSVLVMFLLLFTSLATGVFARLHPEWHAFEIWGLAFAAASLFFLSILIHELSHALVGKAFGVRFLGITLFIFGGVAQIEDDAPHPLAELVMAAAGPLTSILIGLGSTALGLFLAGDVGPVLIRNPEAALAKLGPASALLLWLGPVNLTLALFNMIPGFPLDGGRVLRALLWLVTGNLRRATRIAASFGQSVGYLLIGAGVLMTFGVHIPILGGGLGTGIWIALIGWFLANAARSSYVQLVMRETLQGVPVARVMSASYESVLPSLTIESLVQESMMRSNQRCFPVMVDGYLLGVVCMEDVRKVPHHAWRTTAVERVMTPVAELLTVAPSDPATQAMRLMTSRDVDQLPVVESGQLQGFVRLQDLLRWITLQANVGLN